MDTSVGQRDGVGFGSYAAGAKEKATTLRIKMVTPLVGYLAYLIIERWTGGIMAAAAAGPIGYGFFVWILRKAD